MGEAKPTTNLIHHVLHYKSSYSCSFLPLPAKYETEEKSAKTRKNRIPQSKNQIGIPSSIAAGKTKKMMGILLPFWKNIFFDKGFNNKKQNK